jgi:PPOX class probable F420-dependent enzyme
VTGNPVRRPLGKRLGPLYERLAGGRATLAGVPHAPSNSVLYLSGAKCLLLESERCGGVPVPTRVWFAAVNETVFILAEVASGTVRRIERHPIVKVAACTFRGTPFSDYIECTARIVAPEREPEAEAALRRQYGPARRLFNALARNEHTYLELTPLAANPVPEDAAQGVAVRAIHQARHEHPPCYEHPPGAA